jgi:hypothetical protein
MKYQIPEWMDNVRDAEPATISAAVVAATGSPGVSGPFPFLLCE